jgi:predicted ATPase
MVMAKYIRIRHFGPIAESGELDIKDVMVFCGQQGSGKSTIAKLISTCSWIEKALARKEITRKDLTAKSFRERYCGYHYLSNFFKEGETSIHYHGELVDIKYVNDTIGVIENENASYHMPQIMYVPAERNFMVAVEQAEKIRNLPPSLLTLQQVFKKALNMGDYKIPIDGFSVHYDKLNKIAWLHGKDYRLRMHEAASGLQSVIPLVVVSDYLSLMVERGESHEMSAEELDKLQREVNAILEDSNLNEALRRILIERLNKRYKNECFLNIVEEPEQNLFPM